VQVIQPNVALSGLQRLLLFGGKVLFALVDHGSPLAVVRAELLRVGLHAR
jgi:hypothetical protein